MFLSEPQASIWVLKKDRPRYRDCWMQQGTFHWKARSVSEQGLAPGPVSPPIQPLWLDLLWLPSLSFCSEQGPNQNHLSLQTFSMFHLLSLAKSPRPDGPCLNSERICRAGPHLLSANGPLLWEGDLERHWNCPCWLDPRVWGKGLRRPLGWVYLLDHPVHIWKTNHRFESLHFEETVIIWKLIHCLLNWNLLLLVIWCDHQRNWLRFLWLSESWVSLPVCLFIFTWLSFFLSF